MIDLHPESRILLLMNPPIIIRLLSVLPIVLMRNEFLLTTLWSRDLICLQKQNSFIVHVSP